MKRMMNIAIATLTLMFAAQAQAAIWELACYASPKQFDEKTGAKLPQDFNSVTSHSCMQTDNLVTSLKFSVIEANTILLGLKSTNPRLGESEIVMKFSSRQSALRFEKLMRSGAVTGIGIKPGEISYELDEEGNVIEGPVPASKFFVKTQNLNAASKLGFKISNSLGLWLD